MIKGNSFDSMLLFSMLHVWVFLFFSCLLCVFWGGGSFFLIFRFLYLLKNNESTINLDVTVFQVCTDMTFKY
jgi:hypothetical protein